ncbi:hypothetical protein SS50377_27705 [Spironucleus salmonicida]|uniref:Tetratricopeptide repeat-containing protein n=1 Tax=Spironucleus salmonicida TaxID=348837 RepID=V6M066_9EUKA|nr:hypothetical protein SS50377_27705 [Spironucleus salmonicida]|eukprot:EST46519.1 hypothetical protein SS50377_13324 [Spironucleus salmonicida]
MSELFRKDPQDLQVVIFTALQYQALGDHTTAISLLDYFVTTTETNKIPILIIQLYLKSLIHNREYRQAFRLLDQFVNSPDYASHRATLENAGTSMQVTVILTLQYLELFNLIMNVYKSSFIEKTLLNEPQFILTFSTLFNKIQNLFREEPGFCTKNYQSSEIFRKVVDRTVFVHNFISAKCVSTLNRKYQFRSEKMHQLIYIIKIIKNINEIGDSTTGNIERKATISSVNLHAKGALLSLELLRTVQNAIFEETENSGLKTVFQEAQDLVETFISYSLSTYQIIVANPAFQKCVWYEKLGYQNVNLQLIYTLKNEIQIVQILNIVIIEDFLDYIKCLLIKFRSEVQENQHFNDFKSTITEHIKLFITIGDISAQKQFSLLSFTIYCVVQKIYFLLDNLTEKQLNNYFMDGQVDFARDFYKLQVINPLNLLLSSDNYIENMNFLFLFDRNQDTYNMLLDTFNPLTTVFDFENQNFNPKNREFEYNFQVFKLRSTAHLSSFNLTEFRPIIAIRISSIYTQLAQFLLTKNDISQAISLAQIAVKIWPSENAYFLMIKAYGQLNDGNAAGAIAAECCRFHCENDRAKLFSGSDVVVTSV